MQGMVCGVCVFVTVPAAIAIASAATLLLPPLLPYKLQLSHSAELLARWNTTGNNACLIFLRLQLPNSLRV
jgi:hypothetical protein